MDFLDLIATDSEQKKRFDKACSADVTPTRIDIDSQTGEFKGSGKTPYIATLRNCSCGDFIRRKQPCKHIYRLAIELGLISCDFQVGRNKNSLESDLNNLSKNAQLLIYNLCYLNIYHGVEKFFLCKNKDSESLLYKGFCIEDLTNYHAAINNSPISFIHTQMELCTNIASMPSLKCRKATVSKWIDELSTQELHDNFIVLEFTDQTNGFKHKIYRNLGKKYFNATEEGHQ